MNAFRNGTCCYAKAVAFILNRTKNLKILPYVELKSTICMSSKIKDVNGSKLHNYFMSLRKKRHCQLHHDMILSHRVNCERHHNFRDIKMGKYGCLRINKMQ